jgi:hypothetical protein
MYFVEHGLPHIHARHGGRVAQITIEGPDLLSGGLNPRTFARVIEWTSLHKEELLENWRRLREDRPTKRIAALE